MFYFIYKYEENQILGSTDSCNINIYILCSFARLRINNIYLSKPLARNKEIIVINKKALYNLNITTTVIVLKIFQI